MASPTTADGANGVSTPPTFNAQASPPTTQASTNIDNAPPVASAALPAAPATSLKDDGLSTKRPRDARLIHLLLAAQGVSAYQERVPLMIMDFAYRYTSGILSDAFQLTQDGYGLPSTERGRDKDQATVSMQHLRLAMSARQHYQFQPNLPKEVLLEMAQERNKVALPKVEREFGIRLPPEKYTFTGTGWGLKEEWDSETEGEEEVAAPVQDEQMKDVEGGMAEDEDIDNDEFEEVMGTGPDGGGDSAMADV
jgi:transcription initiation factor TFIID subunit 9B